MRTYPTNVSSTVPMARLGAAEVPRKEGGCEPEDTLVDPNSNRIDRI